MEKINNEHIVTVTFDEPFWVALFECFIEGTYSVAKEVISTSEPTVSELSLFFEKLDWQRLHYTQPKEDNTRKLKVSFKRQQRLARKSTENCEFKYAFTKAQQELKKQSKIDHKEKKKQYKLQLEENKERKFQLRQAKKKQKHKGR